MNLRETTRDIIGQVEQQTGFPVQVIDDPDLTTTAVVHMARGSVPAHIVRYKPSNTQPPDYLICYQCGFILRLFANPPDARFELSSAPAGQTAVRDMVRTLFGRTMTAAQVSSIAQQFYSNLMVHLRSVPVGMRIATWLADEYPELGQLERQQALADLRQAEEALQPRVQAITPDFIYRVTHTINAAHAIFWARRLKQKSLEQPYLGAGFHQPGGELLDIWQQTSSSPSHDRDLIDAWAQALDLAGWYQWTPYRSPS